MSQSMTRTARTRVWAALIVAILIAGPTTDVAGAAAGKASFRLSARPIAVTVGRGGAATVTLSATRVRGFTLPINLRSTVLPAGVQVSVKQNPITGSATVVTFAATSTASLGRKSLTVTGVAGSSSASLRLTVNVVAKAPINTVPIPVDAGSSISLPVRALPSEAVPIVNPATLLLAPGQSASVIFSPRGARAGVSTTYGVSGLPPGLTAEIIIAGEAVQIRYSAQAGLPSVPIVTVLRASQGGVVIATATVTVNPGPSTSPGTPSASTTTVAAGTSTTPASGASTTVATGGPTTTVASPGTSTSTTSTSLTSAATTTTAAPASAATTAGGDLILTAR